MGVDGNAHHPHDGGPPLGAERGRRLPSHLRNTMTRRSSSGRNMPQGEHTLWTLTDLAVRDCCIRALGVLYAHRGQLLRGRVPRAVRPCARETAAWSPSRRTAMCSPATRCPVITSSTATISETRSGSSAFEELLSGGPYLDEVCTTLGTLREKNEKCGKCPHFERCNGGCRAIALALTGDKLGIDPSKCFFWENGYAEKIAAALPDYETNI